MSVSLSYDPQLSRVRITADGLTVTDAFGRTVSNGWGTSDSGHVWTTSGGSAADYAVTGSAGRHIMTAIGTPLFSLIGDGYSDIDQTVLIGQSVVAAGSHISRGLVYGVMGVGSWRLEARFNTNGSITLVISRVVGSTTILATFNHSETYSPSRSAFMLRFQKVGTTLRGKLWHVSSPEPANWEITATDSTIAGLRGQGGVRTVLNTGNTNTLPLNLDYDNFTAVPTVTVERSTDQVRWTTVRGGAALTPVNGAISLDDYEFEPDVRNFYRVGGQPGYGPPQNPNTSFETDTTGWVGLNAGISRSTTRAHDGVASLLIAPDGVSSSGGANAEGLVPVTPGETIRASMWVYSPGGWSDLRPCVDWHDSSGAFLSTGLGSGFAVPAGQWTYLEQILTVPVGAAYAKMRARHGGTPSQATTWNADQVELRTLGITPQLDTVWLKSLARPFLNRPVTVTDWSDVTRTSRSGIFQIVGRSRPVAVTDLHGPRQWTLDVIAHDEADAANLDLLISTGEVQFVHVPAGARVPGGYVALGDTSERRPRPRSQRRIFSLGLTECAPPGPDVVPAVGTWTTVMNTYATWADVLAAHPTWGDLLQLVGSPDDVVVD